MELTTLKTIGNAVAQLVRAAAEAGAEHVHAAGQAVAEHGAAVAEHAQAAGQVVAEHGAAVVEHGAAAHGAAGHLAAAGHAVATALHVHHASYLWLIPLFPIVGAVINATIGWKLQRIFGKKI